MPEVHRAFKNTFCAGRTDSRNPDLPVHDAFPSGGYLDSIGMGCGVNMSLGEKTTKWGNPTPPAGGLPSTTWGWFCEMSFYWFLGSPHPGGGGGEKTLFFLFFFSFFPWFTFFLKPFENKLPKKKKKREKKNNILKLKK